MHQTIGKYVSNEIEWQMCNVVGDTWHDVLEYGEIGSLPISIQVKVCLRSIYKIY